MSPILTRREILAGAAGIGAGALLSPAPFKLLGDTAIWTQNWSWRPRARVGALGVRYTHCTRCDAACPLAVHVCDGRPVGISPVAHRADWQGPPCGAGFLLHQLRFHPDRQSTAAAWVGNHLSSTTITPAAAVTILRDWLKGARCLVVVDGQPGRAASELYRSVAAATGGRYAALEGDSPWLLALGRAAAGLSFDLDLSRARTVLSLGVPLADGFGPPGTLGHLRARRFAAGASLRVVQADTTASRSAMAADEWVRVTAGGMGVLAFGLVRELCGSGRPLPGAAAIEDLEALRAATEPFSPEVVAELAGVGADRLRALAEELASRGPALVLAGTDAGGGPLGTAAELAVAALNVLVGAVGPSGPVRPRRSDRPLETPAHDLLRDLPDHAADLLVCDLEDSGRALPPSALERVMAPGGQLVLVTSSASGLARRGSLTLPRWLPLETHADAMPRPPHPRAYALATPLVAPPDGCPDGIELLARAASEAGLLPAGTPLAAAERVRRRVEALHRAGAGEVRGYASGERTPVSRLAGAAELWAVLAAGGLWLDDEAPAAKLPRLSLARAAGEPLEALALRTLARARSTRWQPVVLACTGWRGAASGTPISPVAAKALRDSPVRECPHEAWVSPATARAAGLASAEQARLETARGRMAVRLRVDPAVPDGIAVVAAAATREDLGEATGPTPGILDLCDVDEDGSWRHQGARLMEA